MRFRARVRGRGTVELPGYGMADAEHRLQKELAAVDAGAALHVMELRRTDPEPKLVENFAVTFRISIEVEVEAEDETAARRAAFAAARRAVLGGRFERVAWEKAEPLSP